jgi:ankyrin repeat protein
MEPASIIVVALVTKSYEVAKASYSYFSAVKNAKNIQESYRKEVRALISVLHQLETAVDSKLVEKRADELGSLVSECLEDLKLIQSDLSKKCGPLARMIWPLKEQELKEHIAKIHRHGDLFGHFVSSCILTSTNSMQSQLGLLNISQARSQLLAAWLPSEPVSRPRAHYCPGTGGWFLKSAQYTAWQRTESEQSGMLWCHGFPGVGKSVLASLAVDDLLQKQRSQGLYLCHFFCDDSLRGRQTTLAVLQTMLSQLIKQGDEELLGLVQDHLAIAASDGNPEKFIAVMKRVCALKKQVFIILDAEDELDRAVRLSITRFLLDVCGPNCRVLITSRIRPDRDRDVGSMFVVGNSDDIKTYAEWRFNNSDVLDGGAQGHLSSLLEGVVKSSNGMFVSRMPVLHDPKLIYRFLLAKLLLDQCLEQVDVQSMQRVLQSAPNTLSDALEATTKRIDAQPAAFKSLAHRTLSWLVNAARPLKAREIMHAYAVSEDDEGEELLETRLIRPQFLIRVCLGFITVDPDDTVRMCHASVSEFFSRTKTDVDGVRRDIAQTALRYLCMKPMSLGICQSVEELHSRLSAMPFLEYSAKHGLGHLCDIPDDSGIMALMLRLLNSDECRWSMCQALFFNNDIRNPDIANDYFESLPTLQTALHVAAYWNLSGACRRLLESGHDAASVDSQNWTPLHWAAANGHLEVVRILIGSNANLDSQDSVGWTPLVWASFGGYLAATQELLRAGADHLISSGGSGWTALHWAISRHNMDIVHLLTRHDRQTRSFKQGGVTKLRPPREIVDDLVEEGVVFRTRHEDVVNFPTPQGVTTQGDSNQLSIRFFDDVSALLGLTPDVSREYDTITIIQSDVEEVDNPDKVYSVEAFPPAGEHYDDRGRFVCHFTIPHPMVSTLAWRTDFKSGIGCSVVKREDLIASEPIYWKEMLLQNAINTSNLSAARLMVELGADVNVDERNPKSTIHLLHDAAKQRDPSYVKLLLENGHTGIGSKNRGTTPLCLAVERRNHDVVKVFLEHGADVNIRSHPDEYTPLHLESMAEGEDNVSSLSVLLNYGSDPAARTRYGKTPLHLAVESGREDAVRVFLQKRSHDATATSTASGAQGTLEICASVSSSHVESVVHHATPNRRLAVDIDVKDSGGKTPLHYAAQNLEMGRMALILVDAGANPLARDNDGKTPLMYATSEAVPGLLGLGADKVGINVKDDEGMTPLMHAIFDQVSISKLLSCGADVNERSKDGKTALHLACNSLNYETADLFLRSGARPDAVDDDGCTPLDLAQKSINSRWNSYMYDKSEWVELFDTYGYKYRYKV